jgi:sterol desaturase/sphingolipid hydroxylase (fatty acid hydroxylase superfamily)
LATFAEMHEADIRLGFFLGTFVVIALWEVLAPHRGHHADLDYDLTTGARFHPLEIVLSMRIRMSTLMVLRPTVVAVILSRSSS